LRKLSTLSERVGLNEMLRNFWISARSAVNV
jgi:hypothetical protein